MRFIVAYDISSDSKRTKAAKILEDFGLRIQYSVFECDLNTKELNELKKRLSELINKKSDSVFFVPLCQSCYSKKIFLGMEFSVKQISFVNVD
jgi:CRISPR-associated protein Cas2